MHIIGKPNWDQGQQLYSYISLQFDLPNCEQAELKSLPVVFRHGIRYAKVHCNYKLIVTPTTKPVTFCVSVS